VFDEQALAAIEQVHGEEITAAGDEITPVVRHRTPPKVLPKLPCAARDVMGFADVQPILARLLVCYKIVFSSSHKTNDVFQRQNP
jgi:hypothetical protein